MKNNTWIIVAMLLMFFGCKNINLTNQNTILHVHRINSHICIFDIAGNSSPDDWAERTKSSYSFQDTCTKFIIGDTILFKPIKQ